MSTPEKPLPDLNDPVVAPYWEATRESRLVVPQCLNCSAILWPPEQACPVCLHEEFGWRQTEAVGTLWSYAVYYRALDPAFADDVPYAVGLIELSGGIKMYGPVDGDLEALEVGAPVVGTFDAVNSEVTFLRWRLVGDGT